MGIEKSNKLKLLVKTTIFIILVCIVAYSVFPSQLTEKEWILYGKSYGVTLGLTLGGGIIGITLGVLLAYLRFQKVTFAQWTALVQTPPFRAIKLTLSLVYLTSVRM